MDLSILVTRKYPVGDLYMPDIRTEVRPLSEAPLLSMPYTSLLDDTTRQAEDMIEKANRRAAAGFSARIRAGQSFAGTDAHPSRLSPLDMPEEARGRMVAVSI